VTWTKLDDGFPDHPKIRGLSDRAFRAHVTGLCYAGRYLTDGWLPTDITGAKTAAELVAGDVWTVSPAPVGFRIKDYLDYNPSRVQVESERSKKQAAGRAGGQASAKARAEAPASGLLQEVPNPVPSRPVPDPKDAESDTPTASKIGSHIPDRWPYFLERLHADSKPWQALTIGGCVKIAQETSLDAVTTALSFASANPPALTDSAYGWLKATAHGLNEAVSA